MLGRIGLTIGLAVLPASCGGQSGGGSFEFKALGALATECSASTCKSLEIPIRISNLTDVAYCFPAIYISDEISRYVIVEGASGKYWQSTPSGHSSVDPERDRDEFITILRAGPQYVIQSGGRFSATAYISGRFELPREPLILKGRVFAFPCIDQEYRRRGYSVVNLQSPVTFSEPSAS